MKNLLVYVNPQKVFDNEGKIAIKIQIDNSLELGWINKDILLLTNFPYKYKGVKAILVDDGTFCTFCPTVSKINAIIKLMDSGKIKETDVVWFHDLDAFQLTEITQNELDLNEVCILLPDWGRIPRWVTGSFFFNKEAEDIFKKVRAISYKYQVNEEVALQLLTGQFTYIDQVSKQLVINYYSSMDDIKDTTPKIKRANITYNLHSFNIRSNYKSALKPIRVAHFHFKQRPINPLNARPNEIDFFLRGNNKLGIQIVPERLVRIFRKYGIE